MSLFVAAAGLAIGAVLVVSGVLKVARPALAAPALGHALGARSRAGPVAAAALGALELLTGGGTIALWRSAEVLAAAMLWSFALWLGVQVARGRTGAPCPCFAGRSRVGPASGARTLGLAALATAVALAPSPRLSVADWLGLTALLLACGCALLAALAVTLAREVAGLRAGSVPRGALEIAGEGPPVGSDSPLIARFPPSDGDLALAVFVSPGCRVCADLRPAIDDFGGRPGVHVAVFDEERDALAWEAAQVPGSPYAVAMSAGGVVLAKGTFNTPAQLESVPATAVRRLGAEGLARA